MSPSFRDSYLTRWRLASNCKTSPSKAMIKSSLVSASTNPSPPHPRKVRRKTLMSRLFPSTPERSATSNNKVDFSEPRKVPWSEWRRARFTERELRNSLKDQKQELHSAVSRAEDSKQSRAPLRIRNSLPVRYSPCEFLLKRKKPRKPSLGNITDERSKNTFLHPVLHEYPTLFSSRKDIEAELLIRYAAALKDPPEFGDLSQPGPVFGTSLAEQIPSPDFSHVPLVLQVAVAALEVRGFHFVGLYRVPGRQREINRFICVANLSSLNPIFMLPLPTWNHVRALTGIVKTFFRRLPKPILDTESWMSLASIISDNVTQMNSTSLHSALRAILSCLVKDRSASPIPWKWKFATLDFLFSHLRRIVALQEANNCSFTSLAICFGPCLFNFDSPLQVKLNMILELMLQHWPWLKIELSKEFLSSSLQIQHYIEEFLENGQDLSEERRGIASLKSTDAETEILNIVKDIFDRTGKWKNVLSPL